MGVVTGIFPVKKKRGQTIKLRVMKRIVKEQKSYDHFRSVQPTDLNSYLLWYLNGCRFRTDMFHDDWVAVLQFIGETIPNRRLIWHIQRSRIQQIGEEDVNPVYYEEKYWFKM